MDHPDREAEVLGCRWRPASDAVAHAEVLVADPLEAEVGVLGLKSRARCSAASASCQRKGQELGIDPVAGCHARQPNNAPGTVSGVGREGSSGAETV